MTRRRGVGRPPRRARRRAAPRAVSPAGSVAPAPPRDVGVRQTMKAEPAQCPAPAPLHGQRVGGGRGRDAGVKGGVEAGDRGHAGQVGDTASSAASDLGWCSGARSVSASSLRTISSVTRTAPRNRRRRARCGGRRRPPDRARRAHRLGHGARLRRCRAAPAGRLSRRADRRRRAARSLRLLDPALTTSTRSPSRRAPCANPTAPRAPASATGPGPLQCDLGSVLAVLARVGARSRRLSAICWRTWPARAASPGTRSITSITRWKRSRSLSITMSNGVVVVPSSL